MGFNLTILKVSLDLFVWRYTKSIAARIDHYFNIFVRENVPCNVELWWRYDVGKFNADAILFGENRC